MAVQSVGDIFAARLPSRIRQAQAAAGSIPALHNVRHGVLAVSALLAFTNLECLNAPIRFHREKLAALLGVAVRTVDRRLAELTRAGFIERVKQTKFGVSGWGVCSIRWTETTLRTLFGAPAIADAGSNQNNAHNEGLRRKLSTNVQDFSCAPKTACRSFDLSLRERSIEKRNGGISKKPQAEKQPMPGIPHDLQILASKYFLARRQIVTLMARCKATNRRLQDVLAFAQGDLDRRGLAGDQAMGWMLTLLQSDRDYGWILRQRMETAVAARRTARRVELQQRIVVAASVPGFWIPGAGMVIDRVADATMVRDERGLEVAVLDRDLCVLIGRMGWRTTRALLRGDKCIKKAMETPYGEGVKCEGKKMTLSSGTGHFKNVPSDFTALLKRLKHRTQAAGWGGVPEFMKEY